MHPEEIKYRLKMKGYTFVDLDKQNKLSRGTCCASAYTPNHKGEVAISKALNIAVYELFPDRYDNLGNRLRPQPKENYFHKKDVHKFSQRINLLDKKEAF